MKAQFEKLKEYLKEKTAEYIEEKNIEIIVDTAMMVSGLKIMIFIKEKGDGVGANHEPNPGQAIFERMEPEKDGPNGLQASQENKV